MAGKKPTHVLRVKERDGASVGCRVGAAWRNDDGSFSIMLNVGTVLSWKDNLFIGIFPVGSDKKDDGEPPF